MNVKKTAIAAVSYAMVAALAIGGTLAYQTDQTPTAKNVMPLGDVDIVQNEYQRVDDKENQTKLEDFKQLKEVKPAYYEGSSIPWAPENQWVEPGNQAWKVVEDNPAVIDKFVTVENIGSNDAYVRTVFAIEVGPNAVNDPYMHVVTNSTNIKDAPTWNWEWPAGVVEIDGGSYVLAVATYTGALAPGQSTIPSLKQIYLDKTATNEVVKAYGDTYEILVFSQAVQTDMGTADGNLTAAESLNEAFGAITTTSHPWTKTAFVDSAEELSAALAAGGEVVLTEDVDVDSTMAIKSGTNSTLNLNGFDINYVVENDKASAIINNAGTLDIVGNGTISFVAENPDLQEIPKYATNTITNTGTLTIGEGVTVTNESDGGASYAVDNHGTFYLNGGTLVGNRCALRVAKYNTDGVYFEMNSGTVTAATPAWIQLPGSNANTAPKIDVVINGGTMQSTKESSADNHVMYTYSFGNSHANTSITINGGEFLGGTVSIGSGDKGDAPTLTINGGTFEYDVLQWLENNSSNVLFSANK